MAFVASVVISNSTREFDKEYDYLLSGEMYDRIRPGMRVIVPFGRSNKPMEAVVLEIKEVVPAAVLKGIQKIIDDSPVLNSHQIQLAQWMKKRYICTYSDAIRCMLPPGIGVKSICIVTSLYSPTEKERETDGVFTLLSPIQKKILETLSTLGGECEWEVLKTNVNSKSCIKHLNILKEKGILQVLETYSRRINDKTVRVAALQMAKEEILEEIENNRIKKIQQIRVLEMLLDNEWISVADLTRFVGVSASVLDTLKKYGYITYRDLVVQRDPVQHKTFEQTQPLEPAPEQANALEHIRRWMEEERFEEVLLHGITGSGKTEVYLQLIQTCLEKEKQAIVLVPEISLTPQMVERFKGRFGKDVAVLHSRLSMGERVDQWRAIKSGSIKVAVGARSAIFAPFENIGLVIIDEEHETSYKSEMTPKYQAAAVAAEICRKHRGVLLYGSATPSVDTYYRAEKGEIKLLRMLGRANEAVLPAVEIVDLRQELEEGNRSVFSRKLAAEMGTNIRSSEQTILFLNRRGHASFVLCRSCGYTLRCPHCNISLTYHSFDERLICHYCGFTVKSPEVCPKCKSNHIRHFGTGTQKIEEEVKRAFPEGTLLRMDMDTTSGKNAHDEILRAFREKNINILVGTQMIAKGHDFPNVTLVGVLAADSLLNIDDYRASERTFQLITQVAGRAGRGKLRGRVIIQSYNTEDFSILAACGHDYATFYNQEIKMREALHYPPFTNIGVLILSGTHDRSVFQLSKEVGQMTGSLFAEEEIESEILGPSRSPMAKIRNKYRWRIVIKCKSLDTLNRIFTKVSDDFHKIKGKSLVELSMDINPANML